MEGLPYFIHGIFVCCNFYLWTTYIPEEALSTKIHTMHCGFDMVSNRLRRDGKRNVFPFNVLLDVIRQVELEMKSVFDELCGTVLYTAELHLLDHPLGTLTGLETWNTWMHRLFTDLIGKSTCIVEPFSATGL